MAVWLCRKLHDRNFSIRLFEINRQRAEELAEKLDWVTVLQSDPTDRSVAEEEHIANADVFVALRNADEQNIIASVLAKIMGVEKVIAVTQGSTYLDLAYHIGVDRAFNPSRVAATEIRRTLIGRGSPARTTRWRSVIRPSSSGGPAPRISSRSCSGRTSPSQ